MRFSAVWIYPILALIPCIDLITIFVWIGISFYKLKRYGIKTGVFGVRMMDFENLSDLPEMLAVEETKYSFSNFFNKKHWSQLLEKLKESDFLKKIKASQIYNNVITWLRKISCPKLIATYPKTSFAIVLIVFAVSFAVIEKIQELEAKLAKQDLAIQEANKQAEIAKQESERQALAIQEANDQAERARQEASRQALAIQEANKQAERARQEASRQALAIQEAAKEQNRIICLSEEKECKSQCEGLSDETDGQEGLIFKTDTNPRERCMDKCDRYCP